MTEMDKKVILALADCGMRTARAASKLYLHFNSVKYHIVRVRLETGLDPLCFYDLITLVEMVKAREE